MEIDDFLVFNSNFGNSAELFFYEGDEAVGFDDFLGPSNNFGQLADDRDFGQRSKHRRSLRSDV